MYIHMEQCSGFHTEGGPGIPPPLQNLKICIVSVCACAANSCMMLWQCPINFFPPPTTTKKSCMKCWCSCCMYTTTYCTATCITQHSYDVICILYIIQWESSYMSYIYSSQVFLQSSCMVRVHCEWLTHVMYASSQ